MSVIGHWRRSALGAGGVALLLPVALTIGVGLTMALGGESTLRALGQVFAGPDAPPRSAPGLEAGQAVPAVPVRPRRRAPSAGGTQAPRSGAPGTPAPTAGGARQPAPRQDRPSGQTPAPEQRPAPQRPAPAAPVGDSDSDRPPAPEPGGSVVHETGEGVAEAVGKIPGPAGETGGDAMQTVVDLIP